jgi:hypothetical protein
MDLGVRTRLIIYLQPWSESMALAPSISWIFPRPPQNLGFFSSSKIRREIIKIRKTLYWKLVPYIEMTFVSKFHLVWWAITQESSLGRKGRIFGEVRVSINLLSSPTAQCLTWPRQCPTCNLSFQRPPTGQCQVPLDNVCLTVSARCSFTVLAVFC